MSGAIRGGKALSLAPAPRNARPRPGGTRSETGTGGASPGRGNPGLQALADQAEANARRAVRTAGPGAPRSSAGSRPRLQTRGVLARRRADLRFLARPRAIHSAAGPPSTKLAQKEAPTVSKASLKSAARRAISVSRTLLTVAG